VPTHFQDRVSPVALPNLPLSILFDRRAASLTRTLVSAGGVADHGEFSQSVTARHTHHHLT